MTEFVLQLLGPPLLERSGLSVQQLRRKAIALVAYLAVDGQPRSRDALAALLWPEHGQTRARANLRRCLFSLNESAGRNLLTSDQDTLRVDSELLSTDIERFHELASGCGKHNPGQACEDCLSLMKEATELYKSDFLFGFSLPDCNYFDEWQLTQSEQLRLELADLLQRLLGAYELRGNWAQALIHAERLLSLDRLEEASHRNIIRLYALAGRRASAYRQYESCRRILADELGEEPEEETEELVSSIRAGLLPAGSRSGESARGEVSELPGADRYRFATILAASVAGTADVAALSQAVESAAGEIVDIGNGESAVVYAIFSNAASAVSAALEAQLATAQRLGIAIDACENADASASASASGSGTGHVDALLTVVPQGEVILSGAVGGLPVAFPSGVSLRPLDYHRLSDLRPAEMLYQLLNPRHIRTAPELRTLDRFRNNLPSLPEPFIGRERELDEVVSMLARSEARILTLTGPAGTGKTRLALHAAARAVATFEHGAFFVDLSAVADPGEVERAILGTMEVRETPGSSVCPSELLAGYLRQRSILLVLDNFEHLIPAAVPLAGLIGGAPAVRVLATSRQKLGVALEREYAVPPLSLPAVNADIDELGRNESVRLFIARAMRSGGCLANDHDTLRSVAEICIGLDGLPLAIELAAARLTVLTPAHLAKMLPQKLSLLRSATRERPRRQQTLLQAIDWSYGLLDDSERRLFAWLSVFTGGWSLEAAEAVCSAVEPETPMDVLEGIASLVDKNLVRTISRSRESRYSMLETIREYARLRLERDTAAEQVRNSHAEYFLLFAERAARQLHGPDQMEWLDALEADYENLQLALRWFMGSGRADHAARMCISLEWFWYRYGHLADARRWLEGVLNGEAEPEATAQPAADAGFASGASRGHVFRALGWTLLVQGDWAAARDRYVEALRMSRENGDRRNQSRAFSGLGTVQRWLGEVAEGRRNCEAAIEIARDLRDPLLIVLALIWAYSTTGGKFDGPPPIDELEEAKELSRRLGDLWAEAHIHNGLGDLYTELRHYDDARKSYERALRSFRNLKDRWLSAWNLEGLARVALLDGDFAGAREAATEALRLFDELGDRVNAVFMLGWLGIGLYLGEERSQAARVFGAFQTLRSEIPRPPDFAPLGAQIDEAVSLSRGSYPDNWDSGYSMSYEETVAYVERGVPPPA